MNVIEKRIAELKQYRPDLTAPKDIDLFWAKTLEEVHTKPVCAFKAPVETPYPHILAYRVTFEGVDDTPLHAWYVRPRFAGDQKLPCIVLFHGYTGGKGYPEDYSSWLLLGFAVLAVDVRGQGGETGDRLGDPHGTVKGWVTKGILDKDTCYYKTITIDALRAVDWVAEQSDVDSAKIAISGASQGGGLSLMVAALSDKAAITVADIPNMCHMDFGMMNSTSSLTEAAEFVNRFPEHLEQVLHTLSYFDVMNLAHRIRTPIMVSVGFKDTVCMPETIFAAYNRIESPKTIEIYPFTGHWVEGFQRRKTVEFLVHHFS
ncbi:acetylxylan esterase [Paenibacillus polymyxa]|uniref:acetylxylan esterase n=1 Tax=Paenibacillus polymyxa TaxID=1406 RepID=UPI00234B390D|nr:alpha/beta fold hydrolase [Paenibacillus polymyxa]WCM60069.1 alpha/beta fold hydrolase [Paenibacillus polymyxa]